MPQFDLDGVGPGSVSAVVRARTAVQAVARAAGADDETVALVETDDPSGWLDVLVAGEPSGRVRDHNRMKFRRD